MDRREFLRIAGAGASLAVLPLRQGAEGTDIPRSSGLRVTGSPPKPGKASIYPAHPVHPCKSTSFYFSVELTLIQKNCNAATR